MELGNQPFFRQDDSAGDSSLFDGQNGRDPKTGILYCNGVPVKESKRKPLEKKAGRFDQKRPKTGDMRDEGAGIGGSVNANHQGGLKRSLESVVEKHVDGAN